MIQKNTIVEDKVKSNGISNSEIVANKVKAKALSNMYEKVKAKALSNIKHREEIITDNEIVADKEAL